MAIQAATQWKDIFTRAFDRKPGGSDEQIAEYEDPDDPRFILHAHAEDLKRLWSNDTVQQLLVHQNLRLEEAAGEPTEQT